MKRKAPGPDKCDQSRYVTNVRTTEHKSRDKWFSNWDVTFPWLQKLDAEGQERAICNWCKDSKKEQCHGYYKYIFNYLTHYQTTNCRLFQTKKSLQTTISNFTKMAESYPNG